MIKITRLAYFIFYVYVFTIIEVYYIVNVLVVNPIANKILRERVSVVFPIKAIYRRDM